MPWYLFTPPEEGIKDPTNSEHYSLYEDGDIPPPCRGDNKMHALNALINPDNGQPEITPELRNEIFIALVVKKESPNVRLKKKIRFKFL